jgi:ribonuclease VapC
VIVDASALMAIALAEPDAREMLEALTLAAKPRVPASTWLEAAMALDRRGDVRAPGIFAAVLDRMQIEVVAVTPEHAALARVAWDRYGKGRHRAQLNFGDCMVYAVAKAANAPLLFKGDDFIHTDIEPALKR